MLIERNVGPIDATHTTLGHIREIPRVAYLSSYPPRECGIATFCEDLVTSTLLVSRAVEPSVIAMETNGRVRQYAWPVTAIVREDIEEEYELAADVINESQADVVSIQHEFGIFGGVESQRLFKFFDRIRKPVVTTLHTVLPRPGPAILENLREIGRRSKRLVIMNSLAAEILRDDYGIDSGKIALIHHGALPPSLEVMEKAKARLGLSGRRVMSTFGLVARGKGLEYAIRALPAVLKRHPELCYVIVGRTHPGVQRIERESYREELTRIVAECGVQDSVRFVNRYVSKAEVVCYLAATDLYITPYLSPDQITSGTLAYALAAGRCVISTPYLYARFLLAEGRGLLVDFRSDTSIAEAVNSVLDTPDLQAVLQRRARRYGQRMYWPAVAANYLKLFDDVARERTANAKRLSTDLQLSLPRYTEGKIRDDIEGSRPTAIAGSSAKADGLLRHHTAR